MLEQRFKKLEAERDNLHKNFVSAVQEVVQKANFKKLLLERKVVALADSLEKKDAQLNEILAASNLDPAALRSILVPLIQSANFRQKYFQPIIDLS